MFPALVSLVKMNIDKETFCTLKCLSHFHQTKNLRLNAHLRWKEGENIIHADCNHPLLTPGLKMLGK